MPKIRRHPTRPIYPTPVGMITPCDAHGKPNIITLGEVFNLSIRDPVRVGLAAMEHLDRAEPRGSRRLLARDASRSAQSPRAAGDGARGRQGCHGGDLRTPGD